MIVDRFKIDDGVNEYEMKKPFFSVIIPAYNSSEYIRKGLDSIAAQDFKDYEIIAPCDRCNDNTESILKEYGAITKPVDYGLDGLTRDCGIAMANGEWILFMDDDDWFLHEFVFRQIADVAKATTADAILFGYIWKERGYVQQDPDHISVHCWSKCFRREFISDVRFGIRRYWSDADFHNRMMIKPHRFEYIPQPMYYYNFMRKGSTTQKYADKELRMRADGPVVVYHSEKEAGEHARIQHHRTDT